MSKNAEIRQHEPRERSTSELLGAIATDVGTLVRKEMELARIEIVEAIVARTKGAAALAVAGALALVAFVFGALAAASALDNVFSAWLARAIVAGGVGIVATLVAGAGAAKLRQPPLAPEETVRTVKEDVEWAKAQLKR